MIGQRLTLLRVYLDMSERTKSHMAAQALLNAALDDRLAGGTMLQGEMGLGRGRIVHTSLNEVQLDALPLILQCADTDDRIREFVERRSNLFAGHLTTLEKVWLVQRADGRQLSEPVQDVPMPAGRQKLIRVFFNDRDQVNDTPLAKVVSETLGTMARFVMTITAVEGFGAHKKLHKNRILHPDRNHPVMLSALVTADNFERAVHATISAAPNTTIIVESVSSLH